MALAGGLGGRRQLRSHPLLDLAVDLGEEAEQIVVALAQSSITEQYGHCWQQTPTDIALCAASRRALAKPLCAEKPPSNPPRCKDMH